ncbi:MAG: 3-hydroxyacyl-CoA dehydrogenase NAD-binding domain-containing protein [Candidatus Thermoplasmatota archaeon]|nr:3-hydroxyacyl-CoA dehydrogenase NAD-binding domain-containing protein [Candidatus Thermoplasmatota archaeon]
MQLENLKKIGVVGSGVMGHGIAVTFARNGYHVIMNDISEDFLRKGMDSIVSGRFGLQKQVEKGRMTEADLKQTVSRISTSADIKSLSECSLIVEAVTEDLKVKGEIFSRLDSICPPETVFASNTSGIRIDDLASFVKRGDRFVGMHWFNPPQVMQLVEVVKGPQTSEETLKLVVSVSEKMGKIPITVNDGPGFFTTRFINSWSMEAYRLFDMGIAGIREIDQMSKLAFGFPMGPFELGDLIGLDTMLHIAEYMFKETGNAAYAPTPSLEKLVHEGYLGKKAGSRGGWYDYYRIAPLK